MVSSDSDIAKFLQGTLRAQLPELDSHVPVDSPDQLCAPDLCQCHPAYSVLRRWQTLLKKQLSEHAVKPGSFLVFSSSAFPETVSFVLGVVLERPSVHMLIRATLLEHELRYDVRDGLPIIQSDRQLFQEMLSKSLHVPALRSSRKTAVLLHFD